MTRGVRLYLVGSFVLVSLAGCGRGFFQSAEREPWRAEAEVACLKSGAVKESLDSSGSTRFPAPASAARNIRSRSQRSVKAAASLGFADDLRPPGDIRNQPRWPVQPQQAAPPPISTLSEQTYSNSARAPAQLWRAVDGPISLSAPGVTQQDDDIDLPADGTPRLPAARRPLSLYGRAVLSRARAQPRAVLASGRTRRRHRGSARTAAIPSARSGRSRSSRPRRWHVRSSRCSTAGSPIPCSRPRSAGSVCASPRSSRSPPIPAAA